MYHKRKPGYKTGVQTVRIRARDCLILAICCGLTLVSGCISPFEPKVAKYDNLLVVDGLLTNIPGSCVVKLSRTYPYDQKRNKVEKKADVKITDDLGVVTVLHDKNDGTYLPEDTTFTGIVGRKYKISISTAGGDVCESGFEDMTEPVDIGNVYYEFADINNGFKEVNFFVDTEDPLQKSHYYSWDYTETWEFAVPYASMSVYLPETKICYSNVASRKVLIESTRDYSEDKVVKFPLYSVPNTTNRLSIKYSLLVRQYVLSEATYQFYRELKNINENTGTLFDPTPVFLTGNLKNLAPDGQPVLGNFQVSGASEKRIFIHSDQLPDDWDVPTEYEFCKADLLNQSKNRTSIDSLIQLGWAPMDTIIDTEANDTLIGLVITRGCFDCTTKGNVQKPDFWDEK